MDDEVVSAFGDDSASGVGILTTLASSRRSRQAPIKIEGMPLQKSVWQTRALIGLMSVGVVSLLAGFVMVLTNGHGSTDGDEAKAGNDGPAVQQPATQAQASLRNTTGNTSGNPIDKAMSAEQAAGDNPLAALIAPPQHGGMAPAPAQAAVIENVIATAAVAPEAKPAMPVRAIQIEPQAAVAATPEAKPVTASTAAIQAPPTQAPAAKTTPVAQAKPVPAKTPPVAMAAAVLQADSGKAASTKTVQASQATPTAAASTATATTTAASTKRQNTRQDDDVALLEAMFAHTRTRPAAPGAGPAPTPALSVPEELKRCASLGGAGAATCRARICVQNPTAAACHQDP